MRIIGIDPGETTGMVVLMPWMDKIVIESAAHDNSLNITRALEAELAGCAVDGVAVEVVIERFNIAQRTLRGTRAGTFEALYTIGAVRYICAKTNVPLAYQEPSAAKGAFTDETLKNLGYWSLVTGPHERDALRHALLYARTKGFWKGTVAV